MTFANPALLLLLWAVPLAVALWVWSRRRSRARMARISAVAQRGATAASEARFHAQLALVATGAVLALVAAARPRWGLQEEIVFSKGRNVVLAVDVSRSMLAEDVRPNRLERARADLRDLIADLRGDRAGLLAFRGSAVLVCPLTTDTAFLRQALEGLSIDSAPRGETDLGSAIEASLAALEAFPGDHNAIVLISDGEDLAGKAVEAARKAAEKGVPIFTVGIGDSRGAPIPAGGGQSVSFQGDAVVTRLDNQTLLDIAAASGGTYIPLATAGTGRVTLGTLYQRHLRNLAAQELQARSERRQVERFQLFLVPAILCFLATALLSLGRPARRRRPGTGHRSASAPVARAVPLLLAACLLHATPAPAQDAVAATPAEAATETATATEVEDRPATDEGRDLARRAQTAFRAGRYDAAAEAYLEAARHPSLDARTAAAFRYNAALAQLRAGAVTNAVETFRDVLRSTPERVTAHEGLGAALFEAATQEAADGTHTLSAAERVQRLDEAAAALQQALRELPPDDTRRRNLAAAAARIPPLREEAHLAEVLEKYGQKPPEELLGDLLKRQRQAYAQAAAAMTNNSPSQITQLEAAARAQQEASDLWLPLAPQLMQAFGQAITNQQDLALLQQKLGGARDAMRAASESLRELDPAGLDAITRGEQETMQFFAMVAPPPPILDEAILAQTNALRSAATSESPRGPAEEQQAALAFTQLFQQRFPAWAEQMAAQAAQQAAPQDGVQQGAQDGSLPQQGDGTLTPEQRAEIERLTEETLRLQTQVLVEGVGPDGRLDAATLPMRRQALDHLHRIRELLPKSSQQQQQQQQEEQQPSDSQQDPQDQDSQPQDDPQQNPEEQPQDEPSEEEQSSEEEQASEAEESDEEPLPEELEALMQRVLQREKEREEDRRQRLRNLPPLLHERDW